MGFVCSKTNCPVDSLEYMVNVGAVSRPNENIVPAGSTGGKHFRIADGYDHAIGGNAFFSVAVDTFQFQGRNAMRERYVLSIRSWQALWRRLVFV